MKANFIIYDYLGEITILEILSHLLIELRKAWNKCFGYMNL
jgi:hypothetical protein